MTAQPTPEIIATLARQAGLDLPPAYQAQLVSAYANVRRMVAGIPSTRPRADEPAHIFVPTTLRPEGS